MQQLLMDGHLTLSVLTATQGHGQAVYQSGLRRGLQLAPPTDGVGRSTGNAADGRFIGLSVLGAGNAAMIEAVRGCGVLM